MACSRVFLALLKADYDQALSHALPPVSRPRSSVAILTVTHVPLFNDILAVSVFNHQVAVAAILGQQSPSRTLQCRSEAMRDTPDASSDSQQSNRPTSDHRSPQAMSRRACLEGVGATVGATAAVQALGSAAVDATASA